MPGGKNYSAQSSNDIDEEVRRIVDESYAEAQKILEQNIDILHAMKAALMEYETIDNSQVEDLMNRVKVRPPKDWDTPASSKPEDDMPSPEPNGASPIGDVAEES